MSKHLLPGLGVLFLLTSSPAQAQTPRIDHQPVGCATAGKFPRLEARFAPPESVATARVMFQGQTTDWYSVTMKPEGPLFAGVLPKPNKSLKSFRYYIEVVDKALGTNRTADYTATVVDSSSACKGKVMAGALASASVILQGPAGVAALPAGFASSGVVAAGSGSAAGAAGASGAAGGGGIGATALVLGGVAVAGGAAVALKQGGEDGAQSGAQGQTVVRSYVIEGFVYKTLPGGAPAAGAVVSTSLDSVTATVDAQGHFLLRPQAQCTITNPGGGVGGAVFTVTIVTAGCPTWSDTKQWGCANADGTPTALIIGQQGINLNCR